MKMIKMALLGGAALAVTAAGAQADDLDALKAQIEALNTRVAAMEATPAVPAGYSLLTISEGATPQVPGLGMTNSERAAFGEKATIISVMPTADAPAGTTITWSGFARAGLVYGSTDSDVTASYRDENGDLVLDINDDPILDASTSADDDDIDVRARGQLRVVASTDTAVGEVGVEIRMRANFNGNGDGDVYSDVAWGYWAMTPELTFGGGYAGSLGNIGYGYDGACTCHYTDNADLAFNPGDVSQMRLSYASGPFSMALALEDASLRDGTLGGGDAANGDRLGAAGEIKYSGDMFSGEISGVWRDIDEDTIWGGDAPYHVAESLWQVGIGVGFALGDIANLSLAAAMGEGPFATVNEGVLETNDITGNYNQSWWGVSALASMNLSDEIHAELAAGYKERDGDSFTFDTDFDDNFRTSGADYETYGVLAGIYYTPVDQLTIGVEGEWYTVDTTLDATDQDDGDTISYDSSSDTFSVDLVSVWRF
jgi:hypothetical protein